MKKYVNKLKRIVAVTLSMALVISLFQSDMLRTFADANVTTPVKNFVTDEGSIVSQDYYPTVADEPLATIKSDTIMVYDYHENGAKFLELTGVKDTEIYLSQKIVYEKGTVLYRYSTAESKGTMYDAQISGYEFILATDITIVGEEPETTASPEATTAPEEETITLDFVPNDLVVNSATATEKYAVINETTIRLYKSPDYNAEGIELTVNAGTIIELVTAYTYSDGQVVYRFDYNGMENDALYNAALSEYSGYPIIPAKYITVGVETTEKTLDDESGVSVKGQLPESVTLKVKDAKTEELNIDTTTYGIGENSLFYDVTLISGGADYQPENGITVVFPEGKIPFSAGATYYAYHIHDDGTVDKTGPFVYDGGDVEVELDGLSYVGLAEDEVLLDRVPQNEEPELIDIENIIAKINVSPLEVYGDITYGEYGVVVEGMVGTEIVLRQAATYSDGTVMYRYDYNYTTLDALSEVATAYPFIHEDDIVMVEDEVEITDQTLTDLTTGITVSGTLPQGTTLSIKELAIDDITLDPEMYPYDTENEDRVIAYDIKLMYNGTEYDPEEPVTMVFPGKNITFEASSGYVIYHVHADGTVGVIGPIVASGKDHTLTVENFSEFIFANNFINISDYSWTGTFLESTATAYSSILPGAMEYTVEEAMSCQITVYKQYQEFDGTTWMLLSTPFFDDDYNAYMWIDKDSIIEPEDVYIEDESSDSGITVSGDLPVDITVTVEEVSSDDVSLDTELYPLGIDTIIYNITLYQDGDVYQPETPVEVTFPAELFSSQAGTFYLGYHIHDDGTVELLGPYEYTGEDIVVTVDSFSEIVLTVTDNALNMDTEFGGAADDPVMIDPYLVATFKDDSAIIYTDYYGLSTKATITGVYGEEIEIIEQVTYPDGTVMYYFDYAGDTDEIHDATLGYNFIPADEVDFGFTDTETDIKVFGNFPSNVLLSVTEESISDDWDTTKYPLGNNTFVLDISLATYSGNAYQPEAPVTISLPQEVMLYAENTGLAIYHVHDGKASPIGPINYSGKGLELTVDGFSQFVFTNAYGTQTGGEWAGIVTVDSLDAYSLNTTYSSTPYTQTGMFGTFVSGDMSFVDASDVEWLMLATGFTSNDVEYQLIRATDVLLTKYDGELITFGENYTEVAPLASVDATMAVAAYADVQADTPMLLDDESSTTTENGLIINKKIEAYDKTTGIGTIRLEAYVTGAVSTSSVSIPSDIILVLDMSSSMTSNKMNNITYSKLSTTANNAYSNYSSKTYAKVTIGDVTKYYPVTITTENEQYTQVSAASTNIELYAKGSDLYYVDENGNTYKVTVTTLDNNTYTYTYTDGDGVKTLSSEGQNTVPSWVANLSVKGTTSSTTYRFTYTYTDASGNPIIVSETFAYGDTITDKYYSISTSESDDDRLEALKVAVDTFIDNIADDANGADNTYGTSDDIEHNVAIVTYSGEGSSKPTGIYNGTTFIPYYSGSSGSGGSGGDDDDDGPSRPKFGSDSESISTFAIVDGGNISNEQYGAALQDMTNATVVNNMINTVSGLDDSQGTLTNIGMLMARNILDAYTEGGTNFSRYVDDNGNVIRNRIVVVFTDGEPTTSGSFNSSYANEAIGYSNEIKNTYGSTVYTVGVLEDADARINISEDRLTVSPVSTSNINTFLHYLSSNYKNATNMTTPGTETFPRTASGLLTGESYYLSAQDTESLSNIFDAISKTATGGASMQLGTSTVVKDIISPYFKLPTNADTSSIVVKTADIKTVSGTTYTWESEVAYSGTVTINDKTIDVSNFDFASNWVGLSDSTPHGKKLVIYVPFVVEPLFLGGNNVDTNGEDAGVYENASATEAIENFVSPAVVVPVKPINPEVVDQYIYITNNADLSTLFTGAHVIYGTDENGATTKDVRDILDGTNNDYADVHFVVKDSSGNVIGVYTIPAGKVFGDSSCSWNTSTGLAPALTNDTTYTIECVTNGDLIHPYDPTKSIEDQYSDNIASLSNTVTVYVFKPEITFDDTGVYYDGITTVENFGENYVTHTWVGTKTYNTDNMYDYDSTSAVNRKLPTLDYTYDPAILAVITEDTYVNVTVATTGTDNPRTLADSEVSFEHIECTGETFDNTKGEFIVHIFTPSVEFKDSNVYLGAVEPTDFTSNTGAISWVNKNGVTGVEMLNNEPSTSITYDIINKATYITDGVITSANDIPVKATVLAGSTDITEATTITHENSCSALGSSCTYTSPTDDSSHFVLHVFTPTFTFRDEVVYYGDVAPSVTDNVSSTIAWKHGTTSSDGFTITGEAPTLSDFAFSYTYGAFVNITETTRVVNTTADIPVEVVIKAGGKVINGLCGIVRDDACTECVYETTDTEEFRIHVKTVEFTVSKTVVDPNGAGYDDGEDFTFTVDLTGNSVIPATLGGSINNGTAETYTVTDGKATFTLMHGQTIKFTSLPVGSYKITEADPGDAYETIPTSREITVTLSKDVTSGTAAFINKLTIADLIITKQVPATSYNAEDTFVFDVALGSDNTTDLTVIINSSTMTPNDEGMYTASVKVKGINVGTKVTVTEDTSWSWRYKVTADGDNVADGVATTTIAANGSSVTFTNTIDKTQWLSSEAYAENSFSEYNACTPIITSSGIKFVVNETN